MSDHPSIKKLAKCVGANWDKKYTVEPEHKIACFLNPPTRRLRMFSAEEGQAIVDLVRGSLSAASSTAPTPSSLAVPTKRKASLLDFSAFEDVDTLESDQDEIACYQDFVELTDVDVIAFWSSNQELFPGLARLARKYLAVPAASTESERLFSKAGIVITDLRASLKTDKIEDILFLYSNCDKY